MQHTKNECIASAKKHNTKKSWQSNCPKIVSYVRRKGWYLECTSHMHKMPQGSRRKWTIELCTESALNFTNVSEWKEHNAGAYTAAKRYGWLKSATKHFKPLGNKIKRFVYIFRVKNTKIVYVGLSRNIAKRWAAHLSSKRFLEVQNKYGQNCLRLFTCAKLFKAEDAALIEENWIQKYKAKGFILVNKKQGGGLGASASVWTYESVKNDASNYDFLGTWSIESHAAYTAALQNDWLKKLISEGIKDRDQIEIDEAASTSKSIEAVVGSRGNILIRGVGSLKAKNRSLAEVQADITRILMDKGLTPNFQLEVTGFESKKFFLVTENNGTKALPLTDTVVDLKDAVLSNIATENKTISKGSTTFKVVELIRNRFSYQMSWQKMLSGGASNVLIQDGDTIKLKDFDYKLGQVFALGGAGNAELVPINPSKRETLADILFSPKGALKNLRAKRSEVYLLRGRNPSVAYHLDAQNVSRILVAAQTELRPNDIVYVADRPIISFSRTLSELNPLRILMRDLQSNDIP